MPAAPSAADTPAPTLANSLRSDSARGRRRGIGVLSLIALVLTVLFFFDPATAGFYPPCLFKTVLGMGCPGCGSLRAVHQMLHGNLDTAWALNKPVVVALPLAGLAGVIGIIARHTRTSSR